MFGADLDVLLPPSTADVHAAVMAVCAADPTSALPPPLPAQLAEAASRGSSHIKTPAPTAGVPMQDAWVAEGVPAAAPVLTPIAVAADLDEEEGKAPSTDVWMRGLSLYNGDVNKCVGGTLMCCFVHSVALFGYLTGVGTRQGLNWTTT